MNTVFQYVNTDVSDTLTSFINEKLEKLSAKFDFIIGAQVYIKHEDKNYDAGKICNIELSLPGPRIFASSNSSSYESAVNETIEELTKQLKTRKAVFNSH